MEQRNNRKRGTEEQKNRRTVRTLGSENRNSGNSRIGRNVKSSRKRVTEEQ